MIKITRIQFWKFENLVKRNWQFGLNEFLRYSADITGTYYRTFETGILIAKSGKSGYWLNEEVYNFCVEKEIL